MRDTIYEVTAHIRSEEVKTAYLDWLGSGHVQSVLDNGALNAVVTVYEEPGGWVVESRYMFSSRAEFDAYEAGPAEGLREAGRQRFGDAITFHRKVGVLAFRLP